MGSTIDRAKALEAFVYDPESGTLSLRQSRGRHGRFKKGSSVGNVHTCGPARSTKKYYLRTFFNGHYVYVHRIIYVMMTGKQPQEIDHIDGNGLNNKWSNLRNVSHSENGKNQKQFRNNTSGVKGVHLRKDTGKWRARIMVDDKPINLGTFADKEDAIQARLEAEIKYGFTGEP